MSAQLDAYLAARSAGSDSAAACALSGIPAAEARFIESDIAKGVITLAPHPLNHNQPQERPMAEGAVAADELRLLIERWERLDEERKAIADDQKDVMAEAKSRGFHVPTIRRLLALRKMDAHERQEADALLETYRAAIGLDYSSTPLGASMQAVG